MIKMMSPKWQACMKRAKPYPIRALAMTLTVAVALWLFLPSPIGEHFQSLPDQSTLTNSYSTRFGEANSITYPAFSFSYPDGWEVTSNVGASFENVELRKTGTDTVISFSFATKADSTGRTHVRTAHKIAESSFWPYYVQDRNHISLGPFAVAYIELVTVSPSGGEYIQPYYAIVPERALSHNEPRLIDTSIGIPGFDYSAKVSFYCQIPETWSSDIDRQEIVSILSSFSSDASEEQYLEARRVATRPLCKCDKKWARDE